MADDAEAQRQYVAGACDAFTTDASGLAATRATLSDPENHIILPEIISKEPLGPVVRHGDNNWGDIVRWTFFALLTAEEKGITQANIEEVARQLDPGPGNQAPAWHRRRHGRDDGSRQGLGQARIAASGNYGEIFAANIGESTPIGLARGLNELWSKGGLQYAPPVR
jgi:general L-amino acid transport system substrate-binding protein